HFEFLERTPGGRMLTGEHDEMLNAIAARDADRADELAHAHTRQFRDNFIRFMSENYATDLSLRPSGSRQRGAKIASRYSLRTVWRAATALQVVEPEFGPIVHDGSEIEAVRVLGHDHHGKLQQSLRKPETEGCATSGSDARSDRCAAVLVPRSIFTGV